MLQIYCSPNMPELGRLSKVYEQSICNDSRLLNRSIPENVRLLQAQQDFYVFVRFFLRECNGIYAVWTERDLYVSALRLEPYRDGLLLEALETAPTERGKGYATALINAVILHLKENGYTKIYSHVDKNNLSSLAVHQRCGFERIMEHAVYADGSVLCSSCTLCKIL